MNFQEQWKKNLVISVFIVKCAFCCNRFYQICSFSRKQAYIFCQNPKIIQVWLFYHQDVTDRQRTKLSHIALNLQNFHFISTKESIKLRNMKQSKKEIDRLNGRSMEAFRKVCLLNVFRPDVQWGPAAIFSLSIFCFLCHEGNERGNTGNKLSETPRHHIIKTLWTIYTKFCDTGMRHVLLW